MTGSYAPPASDSSSFPPALTCSPSLSASRTVWFGDDEARPESEKEDGEEAVSPAAELWEDGLLPEALGVSFRSEEDGEGSLVVDDLGYEYLDFEEDSADVVSEPDSVDRERCVSAGVRIDLEKASRIYISKRNAYSLGQSKYLARFVESQRSDAK